MNNIVKTACGHDINVRCVRCSADYDPVQPRRWSMLCKKSKALKQRDIRPDEARTAVLAILTGVGMRLDLIREYDERLDEFAMLVRDSDGVQDDCWITGEAVAQAVVAARMMAGTPRGLVRPSELKARADGKRREERIQ